MTAPIRRGTARRLGITQPTEVVMTIRPDLTAWHRSFTAALEGVAVDLQVRRDAVRRGTVLPAAHQPLSPAGLRLSQACAEAVHALRALTFPMRPAPCGNRAPHLFSTCTLRAGHAGMHEDMDGAAWGRPS